MKITLKELGRRFNREWIFKDVNLSFRSNSSYAILGPNGSGKSTLLQVIASSLNPSSGTIDYSFEGRDIDPDLLYQYLSIAAPYIDLIEEFSLSEMIDFHFSFKRPLPDFNKEAIIRLLDLEKSKHKALRFFSSGMKQRTKLALAFCSDTPILLLDEPTSNLDIKGVDWYLSLVDAFSKNRLVIVCSNQEHEYGFCQRQIEITDYKKF